MGEYAWLELRTVLSLHEISTLRFGGSRGIRDTGLLEFAIHRPRNLIFYAAGSRISELAAGYMTGIIRNQPFVDGNKRTGLAAAGAFLERHGYYLQSDQAELYALVMAVAAGEVEEVVVSRWIAAKLVQAEPTR
jgi:death-on-curing protein